tara:strand:+ start:446 stop:1807 length:1362 start_codon:yes stop_codon:yes gene_type:complete
MPSTYLTRTISTNNPTGRKTMTFSVWLRRGNSNAVHCIFATGTGSERDMILFESDGKLQFSRYNNSYIYHLKTNRKFRDCSAWYHFVFVYDSTQSTSSDRLKIYVNGVQETSFHTASYPSQDYQSNYSQSTYTQTLGRDTDGNQPFEGCMSHVHYIDGVALAPTAFGSFDNVTGNWMINTSPNVTYGTNGFFLLKDDNSNLDRGGSNNFTINGTLSKTQDNPSNVFCRMNPLQFPLGGDAPAFEYSGTRVRGNSNNWNRAYGSLGARSGKWWYELYIGTQDNSGRIGWDSIDRINNYNTETYYSGLTIQTGTGSVRGGRLGTSAYSPDAVQLPADGGGSATFAQGDYLGMGIDLDNNTITIHKNGSALATNWSYNGYNSSCKANTYGHFVAPSVNWYSSSGHQNIYDFNFGDGKFGSSAALTGITYTDSAGRGVFKYQPPTNYLAWCTRNLNE